MNKKELRILIAIQCTTILLSIITLIGILVNKH